MLEYFSAVPEYKYDSISCFACDFATVVSPLTNSQHCWVLGIAMHILHNGKKIDNTTYPFRKDSTIIIHL